MCTSAHTLSPARPARLRSALYRRPCQVACVVEFSIQGMSHLSRSQEQIMRWKRSRPLHARPLHARAGCPAE
eukprot:2833664-Pleurochrysis_carterae.AAC.1